MQFFPQGWLGVDGGVMFLMLNNLKKEKTGWLPGFCYVVFVCVKPENLLILFKQFLR